MVHEGVGERTAGAPRPTLTRAIAAYTRTVIFFFGLGTKQRLLGPGGTRTCPRCHNTTQWTRVREFRQLTVFFVPVARWKRRQLEICGVCGAAVEI